MYFFTQWLNVAVEDFFLDTPAEATLPSRPPGCNRERELRC